MNLSPATDYPVNLGMACPKGWEALAPLQAPDRATTPLLKGPGGKLRPVGWPEALEAFTSRFKAIQAEHGPASVAWLGTGQIPTEELALLGALGEVRDGDGPRRRQHAPVHGHRRHRLQAVLRLRRAAVHLRGLRTVGRHRARRVEPLHRPPHHVGAHLPKPEPGRRSWSSIRARPRRRWPPRCTSPRSRSRTWRCSTGSPTSSIRRGWIDRAFIDAHTDRVRGLRRPRRRLHARARRRGDGPRRGDARTLAETIHRGRARLVLVDDGRQPEPPGGAHRAGDHQPRPHHRQHRPAGHGRELHHRAVQRDGVAHLQQHDQPVRRARLQIRADDRRDVADDPRHPRGAHPARGQPGLRPDHREASSTARSAGCG